MFADELDRLAAQIWQREHTAPHLMSMYRSLEPIDEREERKRLRKASSRATEPWQKMQRFLSGCGAKS